MNLSFFVRRESFDWVTLPVLALSATSALAQVESTNMALTLTYCSAWEKYQGYAEQPVTPWQQSNDAVKAAGGWRAYAKEAQQPDATDKVEKAAETRNKANQAGGRP